jgi:hypothetical protein
MAFEPSFLGVFPDRFKLDAGNRLEYKDETCKGELQIKHNAPEESP